MSASNRTRTNIASILLHNDENEYLFGCLGKGCVTLATGVVQLYLSDAPDAHKWNKRCCGVATFIKDNNKRSYYIRVYDIKKKIMLWEQELYNQFRYKAPREYFHTFECDKNQAGLNFASEDEARLFKVSVETKLRERSQRKLEKKNKSVRSSPTAAKPPSLTAPINSQSKIATNVDNKLNGSGTLKNKKSKEKKKPRITKDDIGTPTDFKHVSHVGWDPNNGFDMSNLEPDMQNLFQSVGISSDVDEATVEFIYDFVEKHGGIDAVKKEISQRPTPPPPPTAASASRGGPPPPPSRSPTSSAPPPPARTQQAPPPPPSRIAGGRPTVPKNAGRPSAAAPPPPPAVHSSRPPPPPAAGVPPPPSPAAGFPPPPPPPPTVGATPPAPPPPPGPAVMSPPGAVTNGRPNLMDAIRAGKKLSAAPVETSSHDSDGDSRDTLMKAIQSGSKLKPVEQSQSRAQSMNEQDGLVGALARALANRQKAVRGSDDDSDDDDESDEIDDDEWDDN